jgi:hypothetical protein
MEVANKLRGTMRDPIRIGLMIHRNRALLAKVNAQLAEIAGMMYVAEGCRAST